MRLRRRRPDGATPNPIELTTPEPEESVHLVPAPPRVVARETPTEDGGGGEHDTPDRDPTFGELLELFPAGPVGDDDPSPLGIPSAGMLTGGIADAGEADAELASAPTRVPTLVIGDDDADPAPADGGVTPAVAVDPRMRRRRIDVRRAAGRRRLIVVVTAVVVVLAALGALVLVASPLFKVDTVEISGATYTTPADLAPIIDEAKKGAILLLDTDGIEARLEQLPWVRAARVEADFPSTLKIELDERVPIASYQGADRSWRVIDREGRVLAVIPDGARPADYLPVEGPGPDARPGSFAGDPLRIAAELALSLPAELRNVTAALTLGSDGQIGMRLTSGTVVTFGQPSDLRAKLAVLIVLLRDNPPAKLKSVDVSDPNNPAATAVGR